MRRTFLSKRTLRGLASMLALSLAAAQVQADLTPGSVETDVVERVRLTGHVPIALERLTPLPPRPGTDDEPVTLTVVLNRADQAGFDRHLRALYDPRSPRFRHFRSPQKVTARFGPTRETYRSVLDHLRRYGFRLVEGSRNRMTLTVRGTRAQAERAFGVHLRDVSVHGRRAFVSDGDPLVPAALAKDIQAVIGLSTLAQPMPSTLTETVVVETIAGGLFLGSVLGLIYGVLAEIGFIKALGEAGQATQQGVVSVFEAVIRLLINLIPVPDLTTSSSLRRASSVAPAGAAGAGQKVGLLAFSSFQSSDVADYLALVGSPPELLGQVSEVKVNGGAPRGAEQTDVLLGIETVLGLAPGAQVVVYDAPFTGAGTSFQTLFNAMIDGGVTIISNSFGYCEDQTTLADVQSIDAILATAAASGISVFNATGDTGAACRNGSPNTIMVPAGSPQATAVGGTSPIVGPGFTYDGETWWDASARVPPSGQGGFGVSRYFDRPSYQDGVITTAMRSIPDVVAPADDRVGAPVCVADTTGCSTTLGYGGTSLATPIWAAATAVFNEAVGHPLGFLNPLLYPLAASNGFHSAASMGSDAAHVGLGSPNADLLLLALSGATAGATNAAQSSVAAAAGNPLETFAGLIPADGSTEAAIVVQLRDANGHTVVGNTVTLAANGGSQAVITPPSGASSANGTVVFKVTDDTIEDVTFTATDTTAGVVVTETATVRFVSLPATAGGITANPLNVAADAMDTTIVTVTLKDASNQPTPGKLVTLAQGAGHSIIVAPSPSVTDANGQIQFTASNIVNEVVTYTATDVTDGNLPVPGTAQVTFSGSVGSCTIAPPTGLNGYHVTPFATGFNVGNLSFGNVNFGGCSGALAPAFQGNDAFFLNFLNGDVFKLPATGGMATPAQKLATIGPTLGWPVIGLDGHLYATRAVSTGDFTTGIVVELDRNTGAIVRTLASNLKCPQGLVVDPLTGDLFVDGECFGAGSDDPTIHRVRNPSSMTPTVEVYATMPTTPSGQMVFAPSGSLYVVTGYTQQLPGVVRVSGTNGPVPPTVTPLPGVVSTYWLNIGAVDANGEPRLLITLLDGDLQLTDITVTPPVTTAVMSNGVGGGTIGPDGCLYMPASNVIYKLTDPEGGCSYAMPLLGLSPADVSPDPAQGASQTFTAQFLNTTVPAGTPITLAVGGANPGGYLARTDALGQASFSYVGAHTGPDYLVATATLGTETLTSNVAQVTWGAGKHRTFLNLNASPTNGTPGDSIGVVGSLTDVSAVPAAPVPSATVEFAIPGGSCSAQTNASGVATCQITLGPGGSSMLTAEFAGTDQLLESSASVGFTVVGAPCEPFDCTDVDPCTADVCNDGQCQHTAPAGYDGATCYLAAATDALNTASATDVKKKTKAQLLRKLTKIGKLVDKARAGGKKGAKALKKSKSQLAKLEKKISKQRGKKLTPDLADRLLLFVGGAKTALGQA